MLNFLSSSAPMSRTFFLIPKFAGKLVGCWPQKSRSWPSVCIFWISCTLIAVGACGENFYGFVYYKNLEQALEAFCPGITKAVCTLKMILFFVYRQAFYQTTLKLKTLLAHDGAKQKSKVTQALASVGSALSFLLLFSGCTTSVFFCLSPLATATYGVWRGKAFSYDLPFNIILPSILNRMPYYPLTYLGLASSAFMTDFTFSTVDGFFVCACMYISAVFRMLQQDIRQLFVELQSCEFATVAQNLKFQHGLSAIVRRHNEIIDLCTDFTRQFTIIVLMHFLSAAMVLCLSMLNLVLNFGSISMFIYLFYSIAALTQLFLYCIGGNNVSESSLEVAATLYDIEWYKCDIRTKKMILMMLRRAQKAKSVSVPFFTPSLSAFGSILSTAGSYITLLQTFL